MPLDCASLARFAVVLLGSSIPLIGTPVGAGPVDPETFAPDFVHEVFGPEDGLPKAGFSQVTGTPDGFLWIATFDGLVRYDGARFERFGVASTPVLGSNRIPHAQSAADGALWILNETGNLSVYVEGRFRGCPGPNGREPIRCALDGPGPAVYPVLHRDQRGTVWVSSRTGPMQAIGDRLVPLPKLPATGIVSNVQLDALERLWISAERGLWVVTRRSIVEWSRGIDWPYGGHYRISKAARAADDSMWMYGGGQLGRLVTESEGRRRFVPTTRGTVGVHPDAHDDLWIIDGMELLRYREGDLVPVARTAEIRPQMLSHSSTAIGPRGESWVVWAGGLVRERPDGFDELALVDWPDGMASIWIAPSGTVWAVSVRGSLHALWPTRVKNLDDGIDHPNLYSIAEQTDGTVWATGQGLFRSADLASGEPFESLGCPGRDDRCNIALVASDRAGRLWVGMDRGLFRFERDEYVRSEPFGGLDIDVATVQAGQGGTLWAGTRRGLFRLAPGADEDAWEPIRVRGDPEPWVRAIHQRDDGSLWLGTSGGGLIRWREGEPSIRFERSTGFGSDLVRSIWQAPDGRLWIGTETAGLIRVDPKTVDADATTLEVDPVDLAFYRADGVDEVPIHGVHFVVADHHGDLWLSTNEGIFRGRFDDFQAAADGSAPRVPLTRYSERDGMFDREANGGNQHAGLLDRTGHVVFPTQGGLVRIDPEASPPSEAPPKARIDRLVVGQRPRSVTEPVVLTPDERNFSIRITAPHLRDATSLRFRARLVPYESEWVDLGARRTAFYTQVPPGSYRFEATVAHDGVPHRGRWNPQLATLAIDIEPRWAETRAFTALVVLGLIGAVIVGVRWRLGSLRRRAETLERTVAERTAVIARQAEALRQLDQVKSDFFANVSHEFRTPLTLILGSLRDARDPRHAATRDRLDQVALDNAGRLLHLVDQLLDVAKLDAGGLRLDARRGDLVALVRTAIERATPLAERVGVELKASHPTESVEMVFDPIQLEKVLDNLIGNALKFVPRGSSVEVILRRRDAEVEWTVRDDGPGIAPEHLERIFDRFYQVRDERRVESVGTGLGLALSRQIVELHGGSLNAEGVDGGATFVVRLPIESSLEDDRLADRTVTTNRADGLPEASVASTERPAPPVATVTKVPETTERDPAIASDAKRDGGPDPRPTVLVVDDHPELRAYLRRHLEPAYRVIEAADGREALAEAAARTPDVVVTDIMMPELDGRALFRHLRDDPELELVPVILVTAVASSESRLDGLRDGVDDYLVKPFDPRELVARIDNLLASRRRLLDRAVPPSATATVDAAPMPSADQRFVDNVRRVIADRLDDSDLTVEALASAVGCDRSHLLRRLRALTDQTPSALIRTMRLERAEQLLRANAGRVNEIAYSVGFKSLAHFSNSFAKAYGERPSAFAARHAAPVR